MQNFPAVFSNIFSKSKKNLNVLLNFYLILIFILLNPRSIQNFAHSTLVSPILFKTDKF